MSLINLPEEVLIIIAKQLDTKSLYSLYNTCHFTRNIVRMQGVIKECHLSLSTMATARSLKTIFFKDIAGRLTELNLCGVYNLYKSVLLTAMKRLRSLESLNVAYTNITIIDLIEIDKVCNTIQNITINFKFYKPIKYSSIETIQCQKIFEHYKNVHFVGSCINLLQNGLALYLLKLAKLNTLTYSISEFKNSIENTPTEPKFLAYDLNSFNQLTIYLWEGLKQINFSGKLVNFLFHSDAHDFIIIKVDLSKYSVCCSEVFLQFFKDNFAINAITDLHQLYFEGNIVIMFWNNVLMEYNDSFYLKLLKQIDQYFPCNYEPSPNIQPLRKINNDLFIMFPKQQDDESKDLKSEDENYKSNENYQINHYKRKRIALPNIVLNYDELFADKHSVQLKVCNWNSRVTIALNPNFTFLTKLTYLSLSGRISYSRDFFKIVFGYCDNLVTLNIEAEPLTPRTSSIAQSIQLCQKLKHFRFIDKSINFSTLFSSLSQCKTLEIINLCDQSREYSDLADPSTLFECCNNLYYFCIFASMSIAEKSKKRKMLKKARSNCRRHIYVNLFTNYNDSDLKYNCDPYLEVFLLNKQK